MISQIHKSIPRANYLPTAIIVAWMWSMPLLGVVGRASPAMTGAGTGFALAFLVGQALCFWAMSFDGFRKPVYQVVHLLPVINLGATLLLAGVPRFPGLNHPAATLAAATVMGLATAPVILSWVGRITTDAAGRIGRSVGIMLLAASLVYAPMLFVAEISASAAYWMAAILLPVASLLLRPTAPDRPRSAKPPARNTEYPGPSDESHGRWPATFWVPFGLLLVSFYSLSWIVHTLIFPSSRAASPLLAVVGALFYGVVALGAGLISDGIGAIEETAMIGLATLFGVYIIASVDGALWGGVALLMEGSYGIIDLFVFTYLAVWAALYSTLSETTISRGLALYTGVVALGYVASPLLAADASPLSSLPVLTTVAVTLLIGNVALLVLRRHRQARMESMRDDEQDGSAELFPRETVENITPRETEVLELILRGFSNAEITAELGISINTLKTHIRNLYSKAGVSSRAELILKMHPPARTAGESR